MKTLRCWDALVTPEHVWQAWRTFARGKRRRPNVAAFAMDAAVRVVRLARALALERWQPAPYRLLRIEDPKRRIVSAAPVADRVVHHAIHSAIAPWWDRSFSDQSFACLPDRGSHRAVLRFRDQLRRHPRVLQLDMRAYFYSIDRDVLFDLLCRRLPERPLQRLLRRLLDATVDQRGRGLYDDPALHQWLGWTPPPGRGLPIGNLTSQWWGNVYLDGLDQFVQRRLRPGGYQRYMDDVAIFGQSTAELVDVRERIAEWLDRERGLVLKDPAAKPRSTRGEHAFLGYTLSRRGTWPGPKMRARVAGHVEGRGPEALERSVQSMAAAWLCP